ncbi:MAG: nicotinate phosphoribosyltransferase, partial [Acetanaerobacterium sp.]
KIKISESIEKVTTPHFKEVYRLYSNETGMAVADYLALHGEELHVENGLTIFDPVEIWKKKYLSNICAQPMLKPIFVNGRLVYQSPPLSEIRARCIEQVELLWDEVKRFENPHRYYVDLSFRLWDIKNTMLSSHMSKY